MADTRRAIESAATERVQRSGLGSFSFRTLAEQVGVKSSSVHYHFPSKSDLVHALIKAYTEQFRDQLNALNQTNQPPQNQNAPNRVWGLRQKLEGFVAIFESVLVDDKLCLCGALAAELNALDTDSQRLLRQYFATAEEWLTQTLNTHPDQLSLDMSPEHVAHVVMSGLEGAVLLDRVDKKRDRIDAMLALIQTVTSP